MPQLSRRLLLLSVIGKGRDGQFRSRQPAIQGREAWAAGRPEAGPLVTEDVKFLIVHHSAKDTLHTSDQAPGIIASYYDLHTGPDKGWSDVAYNFLIDAGGGIWEGREGSIEGPVAGDATGGNQGFSQSICLIGNFDEAEPTDAALDSLVFLLAWLAEQYRISTHPGSVATFTSKGSNLWPSGVEVSTSTITGHRAMSRTSCPGENLNAYVTGELMADVDAARTTAATMTPSVSESSTSAAASTTRPAPVTSATIPIGPSLGDSAGGSGFLVVVAAMASALAALMLWRHRRTS